MKAPLIQYYKETIKSTEGIENVIISLYAKSMSNSDIEEQIRELYDLNISTSTISRITDTYNKRYYCLVKQVFRSHLFNRLDE